MTQNKVQKAAIRRRMAETGESYVVARRIVLGEANGAGSDVGMGSDVDRLTSLEVQDASVAQGVRGEAGAPEVRLAVGLTPEE